MTRLVRMARSRTTDPDTTRLQIDVGRAVDQLTDLPRLNAVTLDGVQLTTGITNIVSHKLGKRLTGWNVIRRRADARVWDTQDSNPSPDLHLWLATSANVVVDLEVW